MTDLGENMKTKTRDDHSCDVYLKQLKIIISHKKLDSGYGETNVFPFMSPKQKFT